MTLKNRVYQKLGKKVYQFNQLNLIKHYILGFSTIFTFALAAQKSSYSLLILASILNTLLFGSSHVYSHKKENLAKYAIYFTSFSLETWETSHVLSHHTYPNSFWDIELETAFPQNLNFNHFFTSKQGNRVASFITYHILAFIGLPLFKMANILVGLKKSGISGLFQDGLYVHILQISYIYLYKNSIVQSFIFWFAFQGLTSYLFILQSQAVAHHHPDIFHEGHQKIKIPEEIDFGIYQIMATKDRTANQISKYFHRYLFGDHQLHHLFPVIDASYLDEIYPIFYETVQEFGLESLVQRYGWVEMASSLYDTLNIGK